MISRIPRTRYIVAALVTILMTSCDNSDPLQNYGDDALQFEADFASYTEDEKHFIYHAKQLQPKILKGIIGPKDFDKIYDIHRKWVDEVARISKETPSMIPIHSKQINEEMKLQLDKDQSYPKFDFRNQNLQWVNLLGQDLRDSIISGSGYTNIGSTGRPLADLRSGNLIGIFAREPEG